MPTGFSRLVNHVTLRWVLRHRSLSKAGRRFWRGQKKASAPSVYLEALNFIHFGRWIIIAKHPWRRWRTQGLPRFPDLPDEQPPEAIEQGIMLFTSNFDFDWRPYVDTFTETAMDDLGVLWDDAPGWEDPTERGFDSFFKFVDDHVAEHDHYYVALPRVATANIKSALFVDRAVRSFAHQTTDFDDDDWELAYQRLVAILQRDLGTITVPDGLENRPVFGTGGNGNLELTFLAPLPRDEVETVKRLLLSLDDGIDSPFTLVPGTHFGRLTVIHEVCDDGGPVPLESGYILLSVDADGLPGGQRAWLASLHTAWRGNGAEEPNLIDEIWGSCYGFGAGRASGEFVDYMMKISYDATLPFADYPGVSLWDIHRAVATQSEFSNLVFGPPADATHEAVNAIVDDNPVDPP